MAHSRDRGPGGLGRRRFLALAGTASAAGAWALPRSELPGWDIYTDVLVAGSGAAGLCAALEARAAGASVFLVEPLSGFGGASAMSSGAVYAGGGTSLQRTLGVTDTVEAMHDFLAGALGPQAQPGKLADYCIDSAAHFDWLFDQGVPYQAALADSTGGGSLALSGARRAVSDPDPQPPRGHVPAGPGIGENGATGGRAMIDALLARARVLRVGLQADSSAQQLVLEADGSVAGVVVDLAGETRAVRARRGVVLACGGFTLNREMLRRHAPALVGCSIPWGNAGDLGRGIQMGLSAGGASLRMHEGMVLAPMEGMAGGIVVNRNGQRFIAEDQFAGLLGEAIAYREEGRAWLVTDARATAELPDGLTALAVANSIGDLSESLGFPRGALQNTLAYYNRHAGNGEDPLFGRSRATLRTLQGPPYTAWDLSLEGAPFAAHTAGGLHTSLDGEVLDGFGEPVPGLYAAGRSAAGLPGTRFAVHGLSLGDASYFGRRAGGAVAGRARTGG